MATNDKYERFGGVLYHTPVDDTNELITSDLYKRAKRIVDGLIDAKSCDDIDEAFIGADPDIINYINSPFVDAIYQGYVKNKGNVIEKVSDEIYTTGNVDAIKYLKQFYNFKPSRFEAVLKKAIVKGQLELIQYLDESYQTYETNNSYNKCNRLMTAIKNGHLHVLEYLHKKGGNIINNDLFYEAVKLENLDIVKYLVTNGNSSNRIIKQALRWAILLNTFDVFDYLFQLSSYDEDDNDYLLIYASELGRLNIVMYLVKQGADASAHNDKPLIAACEHGHVKIVKYLHKHCGVNVIKYPVAFILACNRGHLDVVNYLHEIGVDIHMGNIWRERSVVDNNDTSVLEYLIRKGVEINYHDEGILLYAIRKNNTPMFMYFMRLGIKSTNPVLMSYAASNGNLEIVKYLHGIGHDINADDSYALRMAVGKSHLDIVKYLLWNGAKLRKDDVYYLNNACYKKNLNTIEFLMEGVEPGGDMPEFIRYIKYGDRDVLVKKEFSLYNGRGPYHPYLEWKARMEQHVKNAFGRLKNYLFCVWIFFKKYF